MGYVAEWYGQFRTKNRPEESVMKMITNVFGDLSYVPLKGKDKGMYEFAVSNTGNYRETDLFMLLETLEPITVNGIVYFRGEDGTIWKVEYTDGRWKEFAGAVCYSKEDAAKHFPPVPTDEKAEFIGEIIDIFEDFLEEKGITIPNPEKDEDDEENAAIIYGSDYGIIQDALELMMRNWKITEEEK